jgi:uncharacterized damage-inducible protein DinB
MPEPQVEQLHWGLTRSNDRLLRRVEGMSDEEYRWQPIASCWTIKPRAEARGDLAEVRGEWVLEGVGKPEEQPPPFTTIAWRLMHLVDVIDGYHVMLFGDGNLRDDRFEIQPTAAGAIQLIERTASKFIAGLNGESDASLREPVRIPWWPQAAPRWRVVANVSLELAHHGAEVGVLRDLYARQS